MARAVAFSPKPSPEFSAALEAQIGLHRSDAVAADSLFSARRSPCASSPALRPQDAVPGQALLARTISDPRLPGGAPDRSHDRVRREGIYNNHLIAEALAYSPPATCSIGAGSEAVATARSRFWKTNPKRVLRNGGNSLNRITTTGLRLQHRLWAWPFSASAESAPSCWRTRWSGRWPSCWHTKNRRRSPPDYGANDGSLPYVLSTCLSATSVRCSRRQVSPCAENACSSRGLGERRGLAAGPICARCAPPIAERKCISFPFGHHVSVGATIELLPLRCGTLKDAFPRLTCFTRRRVAWRERRGRRREL